MMLVVVCRTSISRVMITEELENTAKLCIVSEMPSSRPQSNKVGVPNADIILPPSGTKQPLSPERRASQAPRGEMDQIIHTRLSSSVLLLEFVVNWGAVERLHSLVQNLEG
jgi:hypothetical protein